MWGASAIRCPALLAGLLCSLGAACGRAAIISATPDNYLALASRLQPGDTLNLSPGLYRLTLPLRGLTGRPEAPITIAGPRRGQPAVLLGVAGLPTVSIVDSAYVTVRDLVLDGRNLPGDGVKAEGTARFAHHITLEHLIIQRHGYSQQTVGISTKCPAWNWHVVRNVIVGAGTGMYFGNSDGRSPFVAGLIEGNMVLDTLGYNLQIKHQRDWPQGVGLPAGGQVTLIRGNVFSKAGRASQGEWARPNVLIGDAPQPDPGNAHRVLLYGNLFYRNAGEALFQGEGHLALYNNVFIADADAIVVRPHNGTPRNVEIFHNTIVARGRGIAVRAGESGYRQQAIGNAIFAGEPLSGVEALANVTGTYADAAAELVAPFPPPNALDPAPRPGRLPGDREAAPPPGWFPDANRDFAGRQRLLPRAGAYAVDGPTEAELRPLIDRPPFPYRDR